MSSISSRARAGAGGRHHGRINNVLSKYGLVFLLLGLVVAFSIALPDTFPTKFNLQSLLAQQSMVLFLALGISVAFASGNFDLSAAYWLGVAMNLTLGLQVKQGLPWGLAALIVLGAGVLVGIANGLLVTKLRLDSFIATLGSGSVIFGLGQLYTNQERTLGELSDSFLSLTSLGPLDLPWPFWFVLIACALLWVMLEYLPIGRRLYVLGSNPRAAQLAGISTHKHVIFAFVVSGFLTAIAGILLASQQRIGQPAIGPEYLLPAFTAAILGTAVIRPGRANPWGTLVAILVVAVGITGLLQAGAKDYVQQIFNGAMLLIALAVVGYAQRNQVARAVTADDVPKPRAGGAGGDGRHDAGPVAEAP